MNFNDKKFSNAIKKLIKFKTGVTTIPIKDTSWEELIWAALVFMFGDDKVEWNSQSHEKSVDIKAKINNSSLKISAKGGVIKNNVLSVSSYRLTTFNTLAEKLNFIKTQHSSFDSYLICAREIDTVKKTVNYLVLKVDSTKLAPTSMLKTESWEKSKAGYELKIKSPFGAKIVFKMSDQLWYSIPLDYFSKTERLASLSVPIKDLGNGLINYLRNNKSLTPKSD